jgi:hypothetical protein
MCSSPSVFGGVISQGLSGSTAFGSGWGRFGEDPSEQGGIGRGPAVRVRHRGHIDEIEQVTVLIQQGDRAVSARVDAKDGLGGRFLRS